jgi:magnesium transporter
MLSIHCWNPGARNGEKITPEAFRARLEDFRRSSDILWIDLAQPTPEEEHLVFGQFFRIHALSLEDITRLVREPEAQPHFPKVEEFPDYLFVIVNPLTDDYLQLVRDKPAGHRGAPPVPFTQLSAVLTHTVLITHHYRTLSCIDELQSFWKRHEAQAERGPDFLFHLILDCTVDQYVPVLDHIDDALDALEVQVVQKPRHALYLALLRLKREIIHLRKTLIYEREVLVRLARGEFKLVDEREGIYYRNVYDHLVRFSELIEGSREMVSDLMQSYLAATSNKLNEIMKVLTMISTIVLPMTLIAGIYGMNFEHLPEVKWVWGYPFALFLMLLTGVGSLLFFKWRKWL